MPSAAPECDGLPRDLIGVAGLDDVGPFVFQDALDGFEPEQDAVAGGAGDERRCDGVGAGALVAGAGIGFARNDKDVLIRRVRVLPYILYFFAHITPHPTAGGRVKLGEIADFQISEGKRWSS